MSLRPRFTPLLLILLLGGALLIGGCGQKGDLYLPDDAKPAAGQSQG